MPSLSAAAPTDQQNAKPLKQTKSKAGTKRRSGSESEAVAPEGRAKRQKGKTAQAGGAQKAAAKVSEPAVEEVQNKSAASPAVGGAQKPRRKRKRGPATNDSLTQDEVTRRERQRELQRQAWAAQAAGKKYKKAGNPAAKKESKVTAKPLGQKRPPESSDSPYPKVQVIIVPIYWRKREQEANAVMAAAEGAKALLDQHGISGFVDASESLTPGQKYRLWEGRKVKARVEIGPKDAASGKCVVAEAAATPGELASKKPCKIGPGMIANVQRALGLAVSNLATPDAEPSPARASKAVPRAQDGSSKKQVSQSQPAGKPVRQNVASQNLLSGDDLGGDFQGVQFDAVEERGHSSGKKKLGKKSLPLTEQEPLPSALPHSASSARTVKPVKVVAF